VQAADIVRRLSAVFGESAESRSTVYRWIQLFAEGRQSLDDEPRSGRPSTAVTEESVAAVEKIVMEDRHVTIREIALTMDISTSTAHEILHNRLQLNKISARWVPRLLGPELKHNRVEACRELLEISDQCGEDFWQRILTVDETWLPYFNPETKVQSKEWRRRGEGPPIKARTSPSVGKVMITVFWDCEGIIHIDYLQKGSTITAKYYTDLIIGPLKQALIEKRPGKIHMRPFLQHDNARPHTAKLTKAALSTLRWKILPHPAYSPDLAPSDYHLFGEMKKPLRGIHFETLQEIKSAVNRWIKGTPKEFFEQGLKKLVVRWEKCIVLNGDYVEKAHIDLNDK